MYAEKSLNNKIDTSWLLHESSINSYTRPI